MEQAVVFVIDDDALVRDGFADLLRSVGIEAHTFGSTSDFLLAGRPDAPGCIVLDVRLPEASGIDFQQSLAKLEIWLPVIFVSGYGDVPMSVRAMKQGAIEFLTKPVREQDLLDAVQVGIAADRTRRAQATSAAHLRQLFAGLTAREQDVLSRVVTGRPNKQLAAELGLSEVTVKAHRGQVMRKMGATSLVELVHMAERLGLSAASAEAAPPIQTH